MLNKIYGRQGGFFGILSPFPFLALLIYICIFILTLTTCRVLAMHGFSNANFYLELAFASLILSIILLWREVILKDRSLNNRLSNTNYQNNLTLRTNNTLSIYRKCKLIPCSLPKRIITTSALVTSSVASLLCTASISLTCVLFAYCIIKPRLHGGGDGGDPVSEIITLGAQILILKAQLAAQMHSITIAANTYRDLQYIYDIIILGVGGDLLGAFISKMYISVPTESLYNFVEIGRKLIVLYREICSILPDMTETFGKLSALESRMEILDPNYVRYTKNGLDKMFDSELNVFSIFDNSWARANFNFSNPHRMMITAVL